MSASRRQLAKRQQQLAEQKAERKRQKLFASTANIKEFKTYVPKNPYVRQTQTIKSFTSTQWSSDATAKRESQQYTGDLITGIATMHKSNAVPVLNQQDATEIANMRRN